MDLHYSQTIAYKENSDGSLNPLWIYTTLKPFLLDILDNSVWIPYGFTLLSNKTFSISATNWFESPMDLHYSQTTFFVCATIIGLNPLWIYTTLKPSFFEKIIYICLNPLWIYTTLKRPIYHGKWFFVWIPYGFTLLSN